MAPLRRYLRITKYSVLEVRIYLDQPADVDAWLLKRVDPALPRIIQAIRPLVLPKLREENERGKGRGGAKSKKKAVKDVVVEDDFEVSIFLTELSSRHSILTKHKGLKNKAPIQSNSGKLTNWLTNGTSEQPHIINEDTDPPIVIRVEDEDDGAINLADIPEADAQQKQTRRSGRHGRATANTMSVSSGSDESDLLVHEPPSKRSKQDQHSGDTAQGSEAPQEDDKKKIGLNTSYDGFSIYGRILCLVVKRRGVRTHAGRAVAESSQAMMENWVSTQAAAEQVDAEDN